MSFRGSLLRSGIDSDGIDVTFYRSSGVVTFTGSAVFEGSVTVTGSVIFGGGFTLGDDLTDNIILNGRFVTGAAAGTALDVDATTYQYSEGIELRYAVSDWSDVYTLTSFRGMYLRAENTEAAGSNSIYGMECYGVANAKNTGQVWGGLFYGYVKGSAAVTVKKLYGIQTEVTWDEGGSQDTLSTEATPILAKVTSGNIDDYTKIHGMIIRMGDMDGGSRTFGSGIWIEDDPDMGGTSVFTTGIDIELACTTGIKLQGAMTDGILISGACGDNGIEISGDCTGAGILMSGTNGVDIELPNGATIDNNAAGELTLTEDAIILVGAGHGKIQFGGATDWGTGATGTDIDGTGWDWVTQTVGHVDSGALATACAAAYHALTVTPASHTTASSFFGTWTELYLQATQDFANAANCAAVWGQVEGGASITTSDVADCFTAAGYFNMIMGASLDNNAAHAINGVRVQSEIATSGYSNSGRTAGVEVLAKTGCQDWEYGLYVADATSGVYVSAGTTAFSCSGTFLAGTGRGAKLQGTVNNASHGDGYGFCEFELSLTGTNTSHVAAATSWVNIPSGTLGTGGLMVTAQNNGIWESSDATITNAVLIFGMRMSAIMGDADPSRLCPFSVNVSGDTIHGVFQVSDPVGNLGFSADTSDNTAHKTGCIPFYIDDSGTVGYVNIYSQCAS